MSGPKCADVRPNLQRAIASIVSQIRDAQRNTDRLRGLGIADLRSSETQAEALQKSVAATPISATVSKFAPENAAQLNDQKKQMSTLMATGKRESQKAESLRREAETLRASSQQLMSQAQYGTTEYSRTQYQNALRQEKEAAAKLQKALDHSNRAKSAFDSAISIGNRFTKNVGNAQRVAAERETAARIAEENQRTASSCNSEIGGLATSINSLNHDKFAPGEFETFSADIESFHKVFESHDFAKAAKTGPGLVKRLRTLEQKVASLQTAFETAQTAAQNALAAARAEIAPLDRNELIRWTNEDALVAAAYSQLDAAGKMIDAEQFADSEKAVAASLDDLRRIAKTAEENKVASEQRNVLADVIMNALYEQGYDAPTSYFAKRRSDGSDIEFSDLTIFAKAPGERGDMRMIINLEGRVDLEVENIAEGEEGVCVELIQNLQEGVSGAMDFIMKDWGRGKRANPKEQLTIQQPEQTLEITKERHGE